MGWYGTIAYFHAWDGVALGGDAIRALYSKASKEFPLSAIMEPTTAPSDPRASKIAGTSEQRESALRAAAQSAAAEEAVFSAVLGDPPKSMEECSDEELAALARAAGVDPAALATMSREEKIAAISKARGSALRAAAQSAGIAGADKMPAEQLAAALKAQASGADGAAAPTAEPTGASA